MAPRKTRQQAHVEESTTAAPASVAGTKRKKSARARPEPETEQVQQTEQDTLHIDNAQQTRGLARAALSAADGEIAADDEAAVKDEKLNDYEVSRALVDLHNNAYTLLTTVLGDGAIRFGVVDRLQDSTSHERKTFGNALKRFQFHKSALTSEPYIQLSDVHWPIFRAKNNTEVPREGRGLDYIVHEANLAQMIQLLVLGRSAFQEEDLEALEQQYPRVIGRGLQAALVSDPPQATRDGQSTKAAQLVPSLTFRASLALTRRLALTRMLRTVTDSSEDAANAEEIDKALEDVAEKTYFGDSTDKVYRHMDIFSATGGRKKDKENANDKTKLRVIEEFNKLTNRFCVGESLDQASALKQELENDDEWLAFYNTLLHSAAIFSRDVLTNIGHYRGAVNICQYACKVVDDRAASADIERIFAANAANADGVAQLTDSNVDWLRLQGVNGNAVEASQPHIQGPAPIANMHGAYGLPMHTGAELNQLRGSALDGSTAVALSSGLDTSANLPDWNPTQDGGIEQDNDISGRSAKRQRMNRLIQPAHDPQLGASSAPIIGATGRAVANLPWNDIKTQSNQVNATNRAHTPARSRTVWSEAEVMRLDQLVQEFYGRDGNGWSKLKEKDLGSGSVLQDRSAEDMRLKARNLKVDILIARQTMPAGWDSVVLGKKEVVRVRNAGIDYDQPRQRNPQPQASRAE